jgi:hypothetical protein
MKCTPELRNICVICFLIIIFLCWLLHAWVYRNNPLEAFSTNDLETADCGEINKLIQEGRFKGNIVNLVPCKSFLKHENGWFTRYDNSKDYDGTYPNNWWMVDENDDSRIVKKEDSSKLYVKDITSLDGNQLKTNYMSIGFWIYIKNGIQLGYGRPIIQFGANDDTNPSPSVILFGGNHSHIKITRTTSSNRLSGADIHTERMATLPVAKPSYITITFHAKTYSLYINGRFAQSWTNSEEDVDINDEVRYIMLGSSFDNHSSVLLRNVELFSTPLTEHEVKKLYCDKRQEYTTIDSHPTETLFESFTSDSGRTNLIHKRDLQYYDKEDGISPLHLKETTLYRTHFTKLVNDITVKYIELDGDGQYLKWNGSFDLAAGDGLTIMCWYRPKTEIPSDDSNNRDLYTKTNYPNLKLFDFGNMSGTISSKTLYMWNVTNKWRDYSWWSTRIGNVANGNQWYHYAVTISPKDSNDEATWNIYHNGIPYHENLKLSYPQTKTYNNIYIGSIYNKRIDYGFFAGAIGDFQVYKSELTQAEIVNAMNNPTLFSS